MLNTITPTQAELVRRHQAVRERLFNTPSPPERPRRFIPVRPQPHRPDYVPPAPTSPVILTPPEETAQRVRDVLELASKDRDPALPEPGHWREIIFQICAKHGMTMAELCSDQRSKRIVLARHEAMYRMSKETTLSTPQIAKRLGKGDHTTVLHGIKQHKRRMEASA
jgi:hypothetical protein